ncbi:Holliday junction resolvase [Desulfocurvibacter africanus subsp. africanus str. Walvis Bay]|uniref:Putative pre-16S rRNA nuclease n=1 Tax=Desulfocurvibacter africanus subsp. africanus str. Walvis Bay TaxID=690850 RepID=F3YWT9_DESAF|nr:Holliday junction resolvase [Desulfocurvibacter africanus subsp. africanus str. Walvis Bay]
MPTHGLQSIFKSKMLYNTFMKCTDGAINVRLLGIDFGLKRVGLALTDEGGRMAFPRPALARTSNDALIAEIGRMAAEEKVEAVVLGLPIAMDGEETDLSRQVRNLARKITSKTGLKVHLMDERLTSAEAQARLREAGVSSKKMKGKLDSGAAVLILEAYLGRS